MSRRTIVSAIRAMCDRDGEFESRSVCRVAVGVLPHDADTSLFIVAGHPVFSLTFIGGRAEISCTTFEASFMTNDEVDLSVDALNHVFALCDLDDIVASAKGASIRFEKPPGTASDGLQYAGFDLHQFYGRLDAQARERLVA